jgi:PAS domain S-box-containing protein
MDRAVRILHLEDDPHDREMVRRLLNREGFAIAITHATSRDEFLHALENESFDIILSDKALPAFDGMEALETAKRLRPDVPFVFVSGNMGEEAAAETIKFGATDYVLKERMDRLKVAIERALREADQTRNARQADEALRQSEERFQLIARASNEVIWDWNIEAGSCWVSHGIRLFGYLDSTVPGERPWLDHVHPTHYERVHDSLEQVLAGKEQNWHDEYPFACQDGDIAYVYNRGFIIRDSAGRAVRMVGAMMDVTQRKLAEQLALERTRLAALRAESASALSAGSQIEQGLKRICQLIATELHLDSARIWTLAEGADQLVLQAGAGPMAGIREIQETVPLGDTEVIGQVAAQNDACWTNSFDQITRGPEREMALRHSLTGFGAFPLRSGGLCIGVIAIYSKSALPEFAREALPAVAREVSLGLEHRRSQEKIRAQEAEQKMLEARFLRVQRMESIGTMASGIAHDLNNVLSPIIMGARFMKEQAGGEANLNVLSAMESSAVRGAEIVRQILTFARGAGGERVLLRPNDLIVEIATMIRETFPKSIQLKTQCEPKIWSIEGDPTQIHQVLLNLCVNARDAMPKAGVLTLSSANVVLQDPVSLAGLSGPPGNYVRICVTDTGTGMTPELQKKIFQPFFTTKDPNSGTGLGLSTTVSILGSHGALLTLRSEPGHGSVFSVFFPAKTAVCQEDAPPPPPALPSGKHELVLLVDDEVAIREMCKAVLESFDYRVIVAENGAEALSLLERHKGEVSAAILDMMMPIMDGPTTIRAMRWAAPNVKIIATSGMTERAQMAALGGVEIDAFVQKPFTAELLVGRLAAALAPAASKA